MAGKITIEIARKTLGKKAEKMTDKQVQTVLNSLYALCERVVSNIEKDNS